MPTWNGMQFDEPTWDQAGDMGLAGALAGMTKLSGANWQGFAPWASAAVSGLYGGRDSYLADAYQRMQQERTLDAAEEYRQSQILENEAQARRYDAMVAQQQAEAERNRAWMESKGVDPNTPASYVDNELAAREKARQLIEAQGLAGSMGLPAPTGNSYLDQLQQRQWEQSHPAAPSPELAYRMQRDQQSDLEKEDTAFSGSMADAMERARAGQEKAAQEATLRKVLGDKYTGIPEVDIPTAKGLLSGSITPQASAPPAEPDALQKLGGPPANAAGLPKPNAPAPPPVKPPAAVKAEAVASAEGAGLMPQKSASAPVLSNGAAARPLPEKQTQNPAVPTDEQIKTIVQALPIPPAMKGDAAFQQKLRAEIVRKVQENPGIPREKAAQMAIAEFLQIAQSRGLVRQ